MDWYIKTLKQYAEFNGRARRTQYWMFTLFNVIAAVILSVLDGMLGLTSENGYGILGGLYTLAVFLPGLAVSVRRLHDTNRTGWWLLIAFIPLIGAIVLLVFMVSDSQPGPNQYGANPKEA